MRPNRQPETAQGQEQTKRHDRWSSWVGRMLAAALAIVFLPQDLGRAQLLYDGSLRTLPEAQGWNFGGIGIVSASATNGAGLLDTAQAASTQAGWSRMMDPALDRTQGFTLLFRAQLKAETHNNTNRAGFSIILLAGDKQGIELGFWTDLIFAQSDSPLFTHGEGAAYSTSQRATDYALAILGSNYVLRANGVTLLSGPVRDYTGFGGLVSPYRIPNFLFVGDDTTSASGVVQIDRIAMVRPAMLACDRPGVITWIGVPNESYTVQASSDLTVWADVGTAASASETFFFTSSIVQPAQFLRVVYP